MKIDTGDKQIDELLTRGVGEFIDPDGAFVKKLKENPEKIIIKFGVDPTRPDIHLGHAVVLKKLRQFQDLGCKVIFLVGDYTAQIGDPTGKSKIRPEIQINEILENMKTYLNQIGSILKIDEKVFSWIKNSDWFTDVSDIAQGLDPKIPDIEIIVGDEKKIYPNNFIGKAQLLNESRMQLTHLKNSNIHTVSLSRVLGTLRRITHARLISREMFQERIKNNEELYMHEMMYPILQGIDSSVLFNIYGYCDLEIGGTDQTFNMLIGRDIMKMYRQPEQSVVSIKILEGLDGKEKMSKSLDNYIGITDEPNDMYGKVMSIPDTSIINYFELCTNIPLDEIKKIEESLKDKNTNPKNIKMRLAKQIVLEYHGDKAAQEAEDQFERTFSKGEIPDDVKKVEIKIGAPLVDILIKNGMVESKSEFRRLVEEGAIKLNVNMEERKIIDPASLIDTSGTIKIGKKRFIHITVQKK